MTAIGPVVLVGCGRLGSAMLEGWWASGAVADADLTVLSRSAPPPVTDGLIVNPENLSQTLAQARVLVLAVKPKSWREALAPLAGLLGQGTVVLSVMAGVRAADIASMTGGAVVRVMPTTAVAQRSGVAAVWSDDEEARALGHALFAPMADTVDLEQEADIDAATAVAGSAPAFIYALVQALAEAGQAEGLSTDAAGRLARGALRSAGAGASGSDALDALIARIASPGGTTEAGLKASKSDLERAATAAVQAAVAKARELG